MKKKANFKKTKATIDAMEAVLKDLRTQVTDVIIASVNHTITMMVNGKLDEVKLMLLVDNMKANFPIKSHYIEEVSRLDDKLTPTDVITYIYFKL